MKQRIKQIMKAKDLIKVLQAVNPESDVTLSLGNVNDKYREQCAKAELVSGECLDFLVVDAAVIRDDGSDNLWCDIIVRQDNIFNLGAEADRFDEKYHEIIKS